MPNPLWMPGTARPVNPSRPPRDPRPDIPELKNSQVAFWTEAYPQTQKEDLKPAKVYAFLNPWGTKPGQVNTANTVPVYAIVGNGFVATVNHSTLLQTQDGRDRIRSRKIQHIGFPDPWLTYHPHNMNQYVKLLGLPGYVNQPDQADFRWLKSRNFAAKTQAEVAEIAKQRKEPKRISGQVVKIEKSGQNYALTILGRDSQVIASHIDICTGPGQTRCRALPDVPVNLRQQYQFPPKGKIDGYLQLLTATNFTWERAKAVPNGLTLVLGNGPAAAQAVERALEDPGSREVLWSPSNLGLAFPPTLRLDRLVKQSNGQPLPTRLVFPDRLSPAPKLWPAEDKLFITKGAWEIVSIQVLNANLINSKQLLRNDGTPLQMADYALSDCPDPLLVTFFTNGSPYIDSNGDRTPSAYGIFHQIVIAQGLQDNPAEPGSTFALLQDLLISGGIKLKPLINDRLSAAVGLESEDGRIRVLGSAAHGNKLFPTLTGQNGKNLVNFEKTLPAQAQIVQQGVTLSALTTAYANKYFKASPVTRNPSVNTACLSDLQDMVGDPDLGSDIEQARMFRIAPFENLATLTGAVSLYRRNKQRLLPPRDESQYDRFVRLMNDDARLAAITDPQVAVQLQACQFSYEVGDYSARR